MTLPPSFFFWVFLPQWGVVKAVCEPTTTDAETAEVKYAALVRDDKSPLWPAHTVDDMRCLDEAAAEALEVLCIATSGGSSRAADAAEMESLRQADRAERRHDNHTHPDDRTLPAWQE